MSKCEAMCGNNTKVFGCAFCPECYKAYTNSRFILAFIGADRVPQKSESSLDYLILNPCDGYHIVEAMFDDNGNFEYFYEFMGDPIYPEDNFYVAWAELPESLGQQMQHFLEGIGVK